MNDPLAIIEASPADEIFYAEVVAPVAAGLFAADSGWVENPPAEREYHRAVRIVAATTGLHEDIIHTLVWDLV
tara:strand:+ start:728 stop:946 length:219 start_codon:yes stop_codon:yes gene_type:complete